MQLWNRRDVEAFFIALDHDMETSWHKSKIPGLTPRGYNPGRQCGDCWSQQPDILATGFSPMRQLGVCTQNRNNPKLTHGADNTLRAFFSQLFAADSFASFSRCSFRIALRLSLILLPSSASTFTRI